MTRSVQAGSWVLVVGAVAVALSAVVASGHVKNYKKLKGVSTSLQYSNVDPAPNPDPRLPPPADPTDTFSGKLFFKMRGSGVCPVANRPVRVYRQVVNSYPGALVGEATTAVDGSWQLAAEDVVTGVYRARASKMQLTVNIPPIPGIAQGHKHTYLCRGQISANLSAGP